MRKAKVGDQLLFGKVEPLAYNQAPNSSITWSFSCELNHVEESE